MGIPPGYEAVDPRTARRVPLWHELNATNPVFPGDPAFASEVFTTIAESGYLLEKITSLGSHTGTHISVPSHFVEGAPALSELDESFALMPLAVLDVRARVEEQEVELTVDRRDLDEFERRHGRIPRNACVLLRTGFATRFGSEAYFEPAPGFRSEVVEWLFDARRIRAIGSDTFGPDASSDSHFGATHTALEKGGITVENVGPGLARMRPYGDWIAINGARPRFSGFQVGITGFTESGA